MDQAKSDQATRPVEICQFHVVVRHTSPHIWRRLLVRNDITIADTRQNQTKKALWELDNIRRTIHILDFIDDPNLRQSVQKALNRGEAYHRMRRAISYVNSGKFRVKTEAEQQIWNECSRLIANAIIYYNTLLLSRVYEQKVAAGDLEAIQFLKGTSPVAWRDVNLIGNFDFTTSSSVSFRQACVISVSLP
jgi:Tn3 transposase DDE domain